MGGQRCRCRCEQDGGYGCEAASDEEAEEEEAKRRGKSEGRMCGDKMRDCCRKWGLAVA